MRDDDTARMRALARLRANTPPRDDDCWRVTRCVERDGYARIKFGKTRVGVHRFAWFATTGYWPTQDEMVCHTCDVLVSPGDVSYRSCWRNDDEGIYVVDGIEYQRRGHLWLGNAAANQRDKAMKGRSASGDRNGSRRHPERLKRGAENGARTHPETRVRGDRHWTRMHPEAIPRGEATSFSKATAFTVRAIRLERACGATFDALADKYGLSRTQIRRIISRESWEHID